MTRQTGSGSSIPSAWSIGIRIYDKSNTIPHVINLFGLFLIVSGQAKIPTSILGGARIADKFKETLIWTFPRDQVIWHVGRLRYDITLRVRQCQRIFEEMGFRLRNTRKPPTFFGAVSLSTGKFVHSLCNKFDALTFKTFLKKLLRHRSRGKRMVIVLDNAKYHHAKAKA